MDFHQLSSAGKLVGNITFTTNRFDEKDEAENFGMEAAREPGLMSSFLRLVRSSRRLHPDHANPNRAVSGQH
jgi:hypothetical protein